MGPKYLEVREICRKFASLLRGYCALAPPNLLRDRSVGCVKMCVKHGLGLSRQRCGRRLGPEKIRAGRSAKIRAVTSRLQ